MPSLLTGGGAIAAPPSVPPLLYCSTFDSTGKGSFHSLHLCTYPLDIKFRK